MDNYYFYILGKLSRSQLFEVELFFPSSETVLQLSIQRRWEAQRDFLVMSCFVIKSFPEIRIPEGTGNYIKKISSFLATSKKCNFCVIIICKVDNDSQ